jgi:hypothetical protein
MGMRDEAYAIAQVLKAYSRKVRIEAHPISYQTASDNVHVLTPLDGATIDRIVVLEKEIEQALTAMRNATVQVRWIKQGRFAIVVPRTDPQPVSLRAMLEGVPKGAPVVTLGEHYDHSFVPFGSQVRSPSWLRLNLAGSSTPHIITAGTTGSGKTTLMKAMVLSLAVAVSPEEAALVLIDPKAVDGFPGLAGLPHLAHPVITDPEEACAMMAAIVAEMERREREATANGGRAGAWNRLVVVIDELSALIEKQPDIAIHFKLLAEKGRGLLIHLVGGTQKISKASLTPEAVANVPARAVGLVASKDEAYYATGVPGSELNAHKLPGSGSFMFTLNGSKIWAFQAPWVPAEDQPRIIQGINGWWQGKRTEMTLKPASRRSAQHQAEELAPDAGDPVYVSGVAPQDERARRHAEMQAFIVQVMEREGTPPSAHRVRQEYQQRFSVALNAYTAQSLLQRTVTQLQPA